MENIFLPLLLHAQLISDVTCRWLVNSWNTLVFFFSMPHCIPVSTNWRSACKKERRKWNETDWKQALCCRCPTERDLFKLIKMLLRAGRGRKTIQMPASSWLKCTNDSVTVVRFPCCPIKAKSLFRHIPTQNHCHSPVDKLGNMVPALEKSQIKAIINYTWPCKIVVVSLYRESQLKSVLFFLSPPK